MAVFLYCSFNKNNYVLMTLNKRENIINILIGLVLLILPFITSPDISSGWTLLKIKPFQQSFLRYFLLVIFLFINYYYIIPKFYVKKKWIIFICILTISYLAISQLPGLILRDTQNMSALMPLLKQDQDPLFQEPFTHNFKRPIPPVFNEIPQPSPFREPAFIFQFLVILILTISLRLNKHLKELENKKLIAELSYLKAQINPHFLFNTLNNLYALSLKKSDITPNAILKLSGIMRYVVTESNQSKVSLEKEINYIKDYISLQQLRLGTNITLHFDIQGAFTNDKIAPLILITFIENAFKYGVSSSKPSTINISINLTNNTLTLKVINSIVNLHIPKEHSTEEGISNTIKRLEMVYPDKHSLEIHQDNKTYSVQLKINLE